MNDDSAPSSAADLPINHPASLPPPQLVNPQAETSQSPSPPQDEQTPARKKAHAQVKKKYEFVNGLVTNLDVLIYAELCILYYMDNSLFRFLLRLLAQLMFLTPKPNFIPPMPQHRPYIGAIFGPNIICFLLHVVTARSEAGEALRGYLHGGVIIDLIGQKGPTSKLHLVLLDTLVLGLQCFMLAVHVEKERLSVVLAALASATAVSPEDLELPRAEVREAQDLESEEMGVLRDRDIELQPITSRRGSSGNESGELGEDRERLLAERLPRRDTEDDDTTGVDAFWAGTAIVADFHVLHTLRKQWVDYGNASASALQTVGFSAEFAAATAGSRINAATARFQRNIEAMS